MPSILYTVTTGMVLLFGLPSAFGLAHLMKRNCISFKRAWIVICCLFIVIAGFVPAVADGPNAKSWYVTPVFSMGVSLAGGF